MYNIVRHHQTFEDLGTFTLARGLREVRRVQMAKEEQARGADAKGKNSVDTAEPEHRRDEKTSLMRSESMNSVELARADAPDDIEAQRQSVTDEDTRTGRPLMSPTLGDAVLADAEEGGPSEKARGKMRAGRSMSEEMTGSLERLAASGVGRNGFVPTQEWVR